MSKPHQEVSAFYRTAGKLFLELTGWELRGTVPSDVHKAVIIAAPHTSSWDLWYMLAVSMALGMKLTWFGRKGMFEGPWGAWLRSLGGIPIDRGRRNNVVDEAVAAFNASGRMFLLIAPEGRLDRTEYWRSGFYHIAYGAGVPIGLSYLDFKRRVGGLGPVFELTGNVRTDMEKVRAFYQDITPKNPDKLGPMRLRDEELGEHLEPLPR